jgi:hypothetical protein
VPTTLSLSVGAFRHAPVVRIYAVLDVRSRSHEPVGTVETFVCREDAERFVASIRADDPEYAAYLGIEERELETRLLGSGIGRRGGCFLAVGVLVILFALLAWWWSTVDLFDIGLL